MKAPSARSSTPRGSGFGPRDELELRLRRIWSRVLGLAHVGIAGDFFAVGGYSLSALRMASKVEREIGATVSMTSLFRWVTIQSMAHALRSGYRPADSSLIVPKPGTDGPRCFLVHAAGGDVRADHHWMRRSPAIPEVARALDEPACRAVRTGRASQRQPRRPD